MSKIGTSIYISLNRLEKLRNAVSKLHLSESELLSRIIAKSRKLFGNRAITGQAVKYQKKTDKNDYEIHHVEFKVPDYEFATGRRYLFKISVSFLISLAIDLFLDEIERKIINSDKNEKTKWHAYTTNLYYKNYAIPHYDKVESEFWIIPWPK